MFAALSPRLRNDAAARVVEKGQILEAFGEAIGVEIVQSQRSRHVCVHFPRFRPVNQRVKSRSTRPLGLGYRGSKLNHGQDTRANRTREDSQEIGFENQGGYSKSLDAHPSRILRPEFN